MRKQKVVNDFKDWLPESRTWSRFFVVTVFSLSSFARQSVLTESLSSRLGFLGERSIVLCVIRGPGERHLTCRLDLDCGFIFPNSGLVIEPILTAAPKRPLVFASTCIHPRTKSSENLPENVQPVSSAESVWSVAITAKREKKGNLVAGLSFLCLSFPTNKGRQRRESLGTRLEKRWRASSVGNDLFQIVIAFGLE